MPRAKIGLDVLGDRREIQGAIIREAKGGGIVTKREETTTRAVGEEDVEVYLGGIEFVWKSTRLANRNSSAIFGARASIYTLRKRMPSEERLVIGRILMSADQLSRRRRETRRRPPMANGETINREHRRQL